jgi:hypothetical protein
MNSEITKKYYEYMKETGNLKVGTYEVGQLAKECGIDAKILVFLGVRATATQAPIAIKDGWYIYTLEERTVNEKPFYYITIDNALKYI